MLIFVKLILAIPHFIIIYLLNIPLFILTFLAWFGILFTGRYPKAFFDFNSGILRWQANLVAYVGLLRDEYPPFSWEPGEYPLALEIPLAERQSRFRLFIRVFAIIPNYIAFYFVQIAWFFTTFISWFAILITGRYPRGLFKFSAGVIRWYERMAAYLYLLRDEYPPYNVTSGARPGNEVLSAIIGLPLFAGYVALQPAAVLRAARWRDDDGQRPARHARVAGGADARASERRCERPAHHAAALRRRRRHAAGDRQPPDVWLPSRRIPRAGGEERALAGVLYAGRIHAA